ncbi:MAG: hypothetical protein ABJC13_08980 [Acidobacteriota bacterium]
MTIKTRLAALSLLVLVGLSCNARTERTDGTVLLTVSNSNLLPVTASVANGPTRVPSITLRSVAKDPSGTTSSLQDIQLRSYEVRYARRDTGTRLPPPLVESLFGNISVNGTFVINDLPFLRTAQLTSPPLSDLVNFGTDQQTGSRIIPLRITLRFFGRTLSGTDIVSDSVSFDVEVVP